MREGQITINEFLSPFDQLDQENRRVNKAGRIPWHRIGEKCADLFESGAGNVAKPVAVEVDGFEFWDLLSRP